LPVIVTWLKTANGKKNNDNNKALPINLLY